MSVAVLKPGWLTTVQDRGRYGYANLGVGNAGPMDEVALRLANLLVGNDEGAGALEYTASGPCLRFAQAVRVALTGAMFEVRANGAALPMWQSHVLPAGATLEIGATTRGLRGYLAVAGSFALAPVLGSVATDLNAALGPFGGRALRTGDSIDLNALPGVDLDPDTKPRWSLDPRPWFDFDPAHPIHLIAGTHADALDPASRMALHQAEFRIDRDSNRVGLRLDGPRLALSAPLELASEAIAFGTVQLPPGGQPIVLMAEHPTTGGYPRIGQVAAFDLPRLAQLRPGDTLRFIAIDQDEAQSRYLARERELARLAAAIAQRLQP
ncbi:biotin-dependent carboxyltransferase family protein [Dokdonella sp.]|uniref:5-oxoprolinase subunit C family protein n=1 Tax=Dokdonella sp. TaxID=2291710 RepID=UPI0025BB90AC|nr:biotin-dependent carboxyltransferase family protein [Dokdonella sp.]MBX3688154.1 biotin-dependent carboxyltransferase [Dokdonella sp.]